mmetsp:Transcript_39008/g.76715  ORF Transcript_39008/g.76715 Transcript_39008/m.76715 type:complete len:98 (-) Transcript_39008:999-1292(-)
MMERQRERETEWVREREGGKGNRNISTKDRGCVLLPSLCSVSFIFFLSFYTKKCMHACMDMEIIHAVGRKKGKTDRKRESEGRKASWQQEKREQLKK